MNAVSIFGYEKDLLYMKEAYKQAECAYELQEVPIGAVVVDGNGIVIGAGYNKVESKKNQIAHAEVIAIEKATHSVGDWRLDSCWVYVTVEPCLMCIGLIKLSRCAGLFYGISSPLYGYTQYVDDSIKLEKNMIVLSGLLEIEITVLMKYFFASQRFNNIIDKK